MEINLNNNGFGNIGMGHEALDAKGIDAGNAATGASQVSNSKSLQISNLAPDAKAAGLASSEPVTDVPDAALSRDDALGKLVLAAFNMPPPPMPAFAD
jgi:hypothetical protein